MSTRPMNRRSEGFRPHAFDPPEPTDRPICANCGWPMWIAPIDLHELSQDKHTFKCEQCEYVLAA